MPDDGEVTRTDPKSRWRLVFASKEGKILLVGLTLAALYTLTVFLLRFRSVELSRTLFRVITTHIFLGRAAGISLAYNYELPGWAAVIVSMAVETTLVLLFYPLFVFSYRNLLIIEPLKDTIARVQATARAHQKQIVKWGVPGLLLFVWFPFWMTGPLVGCVVGFLIGLRPLVNLGVVLTGTGVATICWGYVLKQVYKKLETVGPYVPFVFVALVMFVAIAIHIRYAFHKHTDQESKEEKPEDNGEQES